MQGDDTSGGEGGAEESTEDNRVSPPGEGDDEPSDGSDAPAGPDADSPDDDGTATGHGGEVLDPDTSDSPPLDTDGSEQRAGDPAHETDATGATDASASPLDTSGDGPLDATATESQPSADDPDDGGDVPPETEGVVASEDGGVDTADLGTDVSPTDSTETSRATGVELDEVVLDDTEGDSRGLFDDLLSGEPIFENKEVLRPSYTPHELPHRKDQINQMATILVSALRGETPSNILIYGKTGTGKTASAKFVSQELESTSQKYDVPCEVEYINCEVTDTQYRVLAQLANKFIEKNQRLIDDRLSRFRDLRDRVAESDHPPETVLSDAEPDGLDDLEERIEDLEADAEEMETVPMTGWPTDRVYSTFFDAVDYNERVVVIMLDEIDKLVEKSGDDTLYNLSRMNSELDNSRISIMGISNDLKFTDFLDPRVKSSLGEEEIVFPPYDANQLRDILQHRADVAFKSNALTEDVIPLCAAFAAQEHGDARRALDLLRTAGELAERSQADTVEEAHVRQAQDKIELDRVVEVVRTLPTQSKIVLFAIILLEKNGVRNINTGEVFNIYKRLCEEIDADVLTQRRVTDLISELDMLGIVNAVVVSKGRYGRTKEISLSVPIDETEAVLLSDSRLGDIENAQPFVQARFDN
jgi:cell division control protein 6